MTEIIKDGSSVKNPIEEKIFNFLKEEEDIRNNLKGAVYAKIRVIITQSIEAKKEYYVEQNEGQKASQIKDILGLVKEEIQNNSLFISNFGEEITVDIYEQIKFLLIDEIRSRV